LRKSTVLTVPSLKERRIRYPSSYSAETTLGIIMTSPHSSGAIRSNVRPAFILAQFASRSARWRTPHCSMRRSAVFERMLPTISFPRRSKLGLLALMLSVEVRGFVVLVEHPDHDTEERRDDRHASVYSAELPRSVQQCGSDCERVVPSLAPARQLRTPPFPSADFVSSFMRLLGCVVTVLSAPYFACVALGSTSELSCLDRSGFGSAAAGTLPAGACDG